MESDPFLFFRIVSGLALIATCLAVLFVLRHSARLFGIDTEMPSESASARSYSRLLVTAVFAHVVLFFTAGLLFL